MNPSIVKIFSLYFFLTLFISFLLSFALFYEMKEIKILQQKVAFFDDVFKKEASSTTILAQNVATLMQNFVDLHNKTDGITTTLSNTEKNITDVRTQVGGVNLAVSSITGSVDTLKKLANRDQELLKKYSKVFFLSENYKPKYITSIPQQYIYSEGREEKYMSEAWPFLKTMLDTAEVSGVQLYIKSAYRSFAEQKTLKNSYSVTYGAGTANTFSADQGYSEHQLGTTIDFISTGQGGVVSGFEKTNGYAWLMTNGHRYGFILSYPKGNNYYISEPWHWRFVGIKLSTYLHDNNLHFYDMEQRDIDTYLVSMFE